MRRERIWVLITDGTTARLCSTEDGSTTPVAIEPPAFCDTESSPRDDMGEWQEKVYRAWYSTEPRGFFCHSLKRRFADHLARLLNEAAREGAYDGLVVVAAPQIIRELRRALMPETLALLIGQVVQDLPYSGGRDERASPHQELHH